MELQDAIQRAYVLFATPRPEGPLDICVFCCVDKPIADDLLHLPLRALTAKHLYEYNASAKSEIQPPAEMAYFLPRLLELIVQGEEVHHSIELYLDRLCHTDPAWFSTEQRQVLQDVALAHIAHALTVWHESDSTRCGSESVLDWMLMWHRGGIDTTPLLDYWLSCESSTAVLHYVTTFYWEYMMDGWRFVNAFSPASFSTAVEGWLVDPAHKLIFAERLNELAGRGPWPGDLDDVIEYVFDVIAS